MPYRATLQGLLERTNKPARKAELEAELRQPPCPPQMIYLLKHWQRLRRRKGSAGHGPQPWEWTDLEAYCRFYNFHPAPWELDILENLDDLYLAEQAARRAAESSS